MFYVVAQHGTAGLGASYGSAEIEEVLPGQAVPREDMTTTVVGPFESYSRALAERLYFNRLCDEFAESQD